MCLNLKVNRQLTNTAIIGFSVLLVERDMLFSFTSLSLAVAVQYADICPVRSVSSASLTFMWNLFYLCLSVSFLFNQVSLPMVPFQSGLDCEKQR